MSDTPRPVENDDDPKKTVWRIITQAIARWTEAKTFVERFDEKSKSLRHEEERFVPWMELESGSYFDAGYDAERHLLRAILLTETDHYWQSSPRPEKFRRANRGLIYGEKIYLAIADPTGDGEMGKSNDVNMMHLVVMDRAALLDVTDGVDIDQVAPEDDRPAPDQPKDSVRDAVVSTLPEWQQLVLYTANYLGEKEANRRLFSPSSPIAANEISHKSGGLDQ